MYLLENWPSGVMLSSVVVRHNVLDLYEVIDREPVCERILLSVSRGHLTRFLVVIA